MASLAETAADAVALVQRRDHRVVIGKVFVAGVLSGLLTAACFSLFLGALAPPVATLICVPWFSLARPNLMF